MYFVQLCLLAIRSSSKCINVYYVVYTVPAAILSQLIITYKSTIKLTRLSTKPLKSHYKINHKKKNQQQINTLHADHPLICSLHIHIKWPTHTHKQTIVLIKICCNMCFYHHEAIRRLMNGQWLINGVVRIDFIHFAMEVKLWFMGTHRFRIALPVWYVTGHYTWSSA